MREEELQAKIKEAGFKLTPQRQTTIQVLEAHQGEALSAEEIYILAREKNSSIGLATVYRFLEILTEHQLLVKGLHPSGMAQYRLRDTTNTRPPVRFICRSCGKILTFPAEYLDTTLAMVSQQSQAQVEDYVTVLHGLCRECQEKGDSDLD